MIPRKRNRYQAHLSSKNRQRFNAGKRLGKILMQFWILVCVMNLPITLLYILSSRIYLDDHSVEYFQLLFQLQCFSSKPNRPYMNPSRDAACRNEH